jgi:hypothetical protein
MPAPPDHRASVPSNSTRSERPRALPPPPPPAVRILTGPDLARAMGPTDWLEPVEAAFGALANGAAVSPPSISLAVEDGTFHAKGGVLHLDRPYVGVGPWGRTGIRRLF